MRDQKSETIVACALQTVTGGSAWRNCVAGASLLTAPATLFGAAAGTAVPGVGTLAGAGVGALWGMTAGCAAGIRHGSRR
jgi:hypothetical protein